MNTTHRSVARFRDSKLVTVALTASISLLAVTACSAPVENASGGTNQPGVTADPGSAAPTVSQGPGSVYEQETVDYTEWDGTSALAPGMYVSDPNGEANEKPASLFGHSAYFKDGAWYVFDPSQGFPQYVEDVYLASEPGVSFLEGKTKNESLNSDLEICFIVVMAGLSSSYAIGSQWMSEGGISGGESYGRYSPVFEPAPASQANGMFKLYNNVDDAVAGMRAKMANLDCKNSVIPAVYGNTPK